MLRRVDWVPSPPPRHPSHIHPLGGLSSAHHFLCHFLSRISAQLEQKFNGLVVPWAPPSPRILHAQPELEVRLLTIVLLCQLHMHTTLFAEESVSQKVLNGEPEGSAVVS